MNPHWVQVVYKAVKDVMKICPHCKQVSSYQPKRVGQYYKCLNCGHKFREKGE